MSDKSEKLNTLGFELELPCQSLREYAKSVWQANIATS